MMSRIDSWHWKISTGRHFQNGHHNTAKIQHCPISSKFDMWVDIDSRHWQISTGCHFQNNRHNTAHKFQHCPISTPFHMWVDNDVPNWFPDIEKFLPVTIFKMATTIPHKFNIVRFQLPELNYDIEKFLPVSIFKMATTIPQKFNMFLIYFLNLLSVVGLGDSIIVRL